MSSKAKARPEKALDANTGGWNEPPFSGWIQTTEDALLILEAARRGLIPRVTRRLVDRERRMITSGSVFVFDEDESGIKRWTDGLLWSPSRILGNFLLYRETDKRGSNSANSASTPAMRTNPVSEPSSLLVCEPNQQSQDPSTRQESQALSRPKGENIPAPHGMDRNRERVLLGSLTNSYKFKPDGMMKKTFSLTIGGVAQHLISYYKIDDVESGRLRTPSSLPELSCLNISPEYLDKTHFRVPPRIEYVEGTPRYRGEADDTETPTRKLPSPVSPPASLMDYPHLADPHRTDLSNIDQHGLQSVSAGASQSHDYQQSVGIPEHSSPIQQTPSPIATSSQSGAKGVNKPEPRTKRFDPYNTGASARKIAKKQKSAPSMRPTVMPPPTPTSPDAAYTTYSLSPVSPASFAAQGYPVPFYPTYASPVSENASPQFTPYPPQVYPSSQVTTPITPAEVPVGYPGIGSYTTYPSPHPNTAPLETYPQPHHPRRASVQDRPVHDDGRLMDASTANFRAQNAMVPSFTNDHGWKNAVGLHMANLPPHVQVGPPQPYGFTSHPDITQTGSHGERMPVSSWPAVKAELGGGTYRS